MTYKRSCLSFALSLFGLGLNARDISHEEEIAMARESAPPRITDDASVMAWQDGRYVEISEGSNEFTCLVLRDAFGRFEPSCFNQAALDAVLPVYEYQTRALEKGRSITEIHTEISRRAENGELPQVQPGALVYMMSPRNRYYNFWTKELVDVPPHIMLYYPKLEQTDLCFDGEDGLPNFFMEYPHLSVVHITTETGR